MRSLNPQSANKNGAKCQLGTLNYTLEELAAVELISQNPSNGIVARQEIYPESGWETLRQVGSAGLKERKHIYIETVKKIFKCPKELSLLWCNQNYHRKLFVAKKNQAEQFYLTSVWRFI